MAQIPLYQQKVGQSTETGRAFADAGSAAAPYKALAQFGAVASDVGFEFHAKLKKEKTEAETAQYMADRKLRTNAMEETLATMQDPDEIQEFYSQWRENENTAFNDTKMNNDSRRAIKNNYEDFYARTDIGAAKFHRNADIQKIDRTYIDIANMGISGETDPTLINENGDVMTPDEVFEYATMKRVGLGTINYEKAQDEIRTMPSKRVYRTAQNDLEILRGAYLRQELTPDEYIDELNTRQADLRGNKDLLDEHGKPLDTMIESRKNNLRGETVKKMTKSADYVFGKLADDSLDGPDLAELYNDNPLMAESLDKSIRAQLKEGVAAGDDDAVKAQKALDEMVMGDESWQGAVRRIGSLQSSYGILALYAANSYAKDIVNSQDNLNAYEHIHRFNDKAVSVDADTKDFVHTMSYYMNRKSKGQGTYINDRLKAFAKWQKNPEDKTYDEFRTEQFGEDAKKDAMTINATQIVSQVKEVTRQTAEGKTAVFNSETKEFIRYK